MPARPSNRSLIARRRISERRRFPRRFRAEIEAGPSSTELSAMNLPVKGDGTYSFGGCYVEMGWRGFQSIHHVRAKTLELLKEQSAR